MVHEQQLRLKSAFRYVLVAAAVGSVAVVARTLSRGQDDGAEGAPTNPDGAAPAAFPAPVATVADPAASNDPCRPIPYASPSDAGDAAIETCENVVRLPCGLPADVTPPPNVGPWAGKCIYRYKDCAKLCKGILFLTCHAFGDSCVDGSVPEEGGITVDCSSCKGTGAGRRPEGLQPRRAEAASAIGQFFAGIAHLEAASVHAFRTLRRELVELGAPRELTRAAAAAMRDEVRHARVTGGLARRYGARTRPPRVRPTGPRGLEAFATENAVEGCVRETYGALFARWQAGHASDPRVAAAMDRIANDEMRHAALAWAIADWVEPRLDEEARGRVARRRAEAVEALALEVRREPPPDVVHAVGAPSAAAQDALLRGLQDALWAS